MFERAESYLQHFKSHQDALNILSYSLVVAIYCLACFDAMQPSGLAAVTTITQPTLLIFSEFFHVRLFTSFFRPKEFVKKVLYGVLLIAVVLSLVLQFNFSRPSDLLFLVVPLLGVYLGLKKGGSLKFLAFIYLFVIVFVVFDLVVLRHVDAPFSYLHFHAIIVACSYAIFFWHRLFEERRRRELNIEIAKLASQVSADLRSPVTALQAIANDMQFKSASHQKIFASVIGRIASISETLIQRKDVNSDGTDLEILCRTLIAEKIGKYGDQVQINFKQSTALPGCLPASISSDVKESLSSLVDQLVDCSPRLDFRLFTEDKNSVIQISCYERILLNQHMTDLQKKLHIHQIRLEAESIPNKQTRLMIYIPLQKFV